MEDPPGPVVRWTIHGHHCYMYQKPVQFQPPAEKIQLRSEREADTPDVSNWEAWNGRVRPGVFWKSDLEFVRRELLEKGYLPRVTPYGLKGTTALRLTLDKKQTCVIRFREDQSAFCRYVEAIGIPYAGERIPGYTRRKFS